MPSSRTAITFRTSTKLKNAASQAAEKVGIPLSLVLTNALKNFASNPKITLTENGFTQKFEQELLEAVEYSKKHPETVEIMTKKEFLDSLD